MYINDHVVNRIDTKAPSLAAGCLGCDSGSCGSCPFKKSDLGDLGQGYVQAGITGASYAANLAVPGLGPVIGGIGGIFSSLFGGGPTKEQKQSGEYYQAALKSAAAHAYFPKTQQEMIEFLQFMTTPSTEKDMLPILCGTKWCSMKCPYSGAEARGCKYILPYQVYKSLGGPYSTANPAYDTFGGGAAMLQGQIIPYFKQLLQQYQASGAGTTVEGVAQTAMNYWPLLLIGGLVYLGSGRRSA